MPALLPYRPGHAAAAPGQGPGRLGGRSNIATSCSRHVLRTAPSVTVASPALLLEEAPPAPPTGTLGRRHPRGDPDPATSSASSLTAHAYSVGGWGHALGVDLRPQIDSQVPDN